MKVIDITDIAFTDREVACPSGGFTSFRFLLESDGMGFSLHKTVIPAGDIQFWHYKNHLEACYCVSGEGILTNTDTGKRHRIIEDRVYALDMHDPHSFKAIKDVTLICVFNPPLKGREVHESDGSYRA